MQWDSRNAAGGAARGLQDRPGYTRKSPDGATTIEQYLNKDTEDWKWQFWVRREGAFTQLDAELADYPADFIFTNDLKWIVRVQKIGSGTATLHLYRLTPQGYVPRARSRSASWRGTT